VQPHPRSRPAVSAPEAGSGPAAPSAPWPVGAATGVGSMPGTDPAEALRTVLGELPELPHLPELPGRGPGADLVGRGAALLVDLFVDLQPSGWRLVDRPGREVRAARDLLERDLDTLVDLAGEYDGVFKVQAAGPWTLAATLELSRGDKALADPGAVRDLAASLAEGLAAHVDDVRRRLPAARVVLQLDEPSLPAVLAGQVRTASGFGALRAVEPSPAEDVLARVVRSAGVEVVVHCCAAAVPVRLLGAAGAAAVSLDLTRLDLAAAPVLDALGEHLEAGRRLLAGTVPAGPGAPVLSDPRTTVRGVRTMGQRLGLDPGRLAEQVVLTPTCGLAGATPAFARAALARCREAARVLVDDPEG